RSISSSISRPPRFLFVFSSMPRPPPTSTLFPYTTLFRSRNLGNLVTVAHPHVQTEDAIGVNVVFNAVQHAALADDVDAGVTEFTDRKSTRLNSSHVKISYAVFCLKKKKQTTQYVISQIKN